MEVKKKWFMEFGQLSDEDAGYTRKGGEWWGEYRGSDTYRILRQKVLRVFAWYSSCLFLR